MYIDCILLIPVAREAGMNPMQIEWAVKVAESKCIKYLNNVFLSAIFTIY